MKFCLNGPQRIQGSVSVSGAKNSALRLLAASLLTDEKITLSNYPSSLLDAKIHVGMLEVLGKRCTLKGKDEVVIENAGKIGSILDWKERSIRNTLLILGALTTHTGNGSVPLPDGCKLGNRSYDLHEMVLQAMGAQVWTEGDRLLAQAPQGGLRGAEIYLPIRSTGATENSIIAGTLAKGTTRVWSPHIRPEIMDLISMLKKMGAKIKVFGQEHIEIQGVEGLKGTSHSVMPDNMEAITWFIASVMTRGDVEIHGFPCRDLEVPLIYMRESGAKFFVGEESVIVRGGTCYPLEISTGPFPGINSDVQPILAAFATCARGESRICDLRFPDRFNYIQEMEKMGLSYVIDRNILKIQGNGGDLKGSHVTAVDLRAGAALTLCGLVADGETCISDAWQIERGYNDFYEKLIALGVNMSVQK